jgi:hypothetical protein
MAVEDACAIRRVLEEDRAYYLETARDFEKGDAW